MANSAISAPMARLAQQPSIDVRRRLLAADNHVLMVSSVNRTTFPIVAATDLTTGKAGNVRLMDVAMDLTIASCSPLAPPQGLDAGDSSLAVILSGEVGDCDTSVKLRNAQDAGAAIVVVSNIELASLWVGGGVFFAEMEEENVASMVNLVIAGMRHAELNYR